MRIDSEVLAAFLHMQELDVQIIRAEKQLQELPERKAIADAVAKRRAVAAKAEQVEKLAAKAEDKLARITEEDDGLADKARRIQDEIEQAQGDFRTVDARTKELTSVQERRDALEEDMRAVDAELEKIKAVRAQIAAAMEQIEGIERNAGAAFSQKGGELKQRIADMQAKRKAMAQRVPADDLKLDERTAAATAGVPLALLVEERCGACRTPIEHGRVVDMRSQGNVAACPNCGRLLILQAH